MGIGGPTAGRSTVNRTTASPLGRETLRSLQRSRSSLPARLTRVRSCPCFSMVEHPHRKRRESGSTPGVGSSFRPPEQTLHARYVGSNPTAQTDAPASRSPGRSLMVRHSFVRRTNSRFAHSDETKTFPDSPTRRGPTRKQRLLVRIQPSRLTGCSLIGKGTRLERETMASSLGRPLRGGRQSVRTPPAEPPILFCPRSSRVELPACTRAVSVQFRTWALPRSTGTLTPVI